MLYELKTTTVIDERVSCNAGLLMIGLCESTVDDHQLASCFNRILSGTHFHGDVAVDDMSVRPSDAKSVHDMLANLLVVTQFEVVALMLNMCFLVFDEIALEGSHLRLVEERAVRTAPEIEEIINGIVALHRVGVALVSGAYQMPDGLHQIFSCHRLTLIDFHFFQAAIFFERYGCMIEQVVVAYQVHTAMVEQHVDMFVELLTDHKAMMQSLQQFVLLICENARIGRIDGWKMATTQRVDLPFKHDRTMFIIDEIEKLGLEVYYNGDRAMTEFKIKCYKKDGGKWRYIGIYTPDFIILKRRDGKIHKAIIVETKGSIYASDPIFKDKRAFMESEFKKQNNYAFGYERFDYLYLEDSMPDAERLSLTHKMICDFFKEC